MLRKVIYYIVFLSAIVGFSQENPTIASLHVRGLKKTKQGFIRKIMQAKSGKQLDSLQLNQDIARLKRLPGISHAYYQVFYSHENQYNVFYEIEENFTLIPSANIWTSTNDRFSYKIGLNDFNFLGRGISFGGFYQNNGYNTYSINLRAPYLFSRKLGLAISYQDWKSEEPLYFQDETANYLYNNKSLEILGLYELSVQHKFHLGVSFFNEKYNYLSGDISSEVPRRLDIDKVLFKLVYDFDKLKYHYQYVDGFRSLFIGQTVKSQNNFQDDFYIGWNDFFYYKRIGTKGNWANRLRIGFSSNNDSPFAPFALDNNINIRGVGNLIDRGTAVILLNTEYRHTLIEKGWFVLQGNAFVDSGTWRNPGGELSDFTKSENIRVYPGLGLRFMHNKIYNAIFRIDYGYGITENSTNGIVFGIGQYF